MITLNVTGNKDNSTVRAFLGLSRDTKPVRWFQDSMIPNGSTYYEIDTARTYMYSFEDEKWYFQPSASPGGGTGVTIEDVNKLKGEICWTCNSGIKLFSQTDWRPQYYAIADGTVLKYSMPHVVVCSKYIRE